MTLLPCGTSRGFFVNALLMSFTPTAEKPESWDDWQHAAREYPLLFITFMGLRLAHFKAPLPIGFSEVQNVMLHLPLPTLFAPQTR
jgi:hypothetical protein